MSRYQSSLKALLIVLVIAFVADVIALAVPLGRTDPERLAMLVIAFAFLTPFWLPFVIMFLPPSTARRLLKEIGLLAILTFVFFVPHLSNRDPRHEWSWCVCGALFCLTLTFWLGYVGSKERFERLSREGWIPPAREVVEPDTRSPLRDRELDG